MIGLLEPLDHKDPGAWMTSEELLRLERCIRALALPVVLMRFKQK
jgi:hypothetical protein